MKLQIKSCVLALICLSIAFALPAAAAQPTSELVAAGDSSTAYYLLHHPQALAKFLHLSSSQTKQLVGFYNTLVQTDTPLRQARGPLCTQLITDLSANPPQSSVVGADAINLFDNKQQIVDARKAFDTSFSAILTPGQLAAYQALKQISRDSDPDINVIGDCPRPTS